MFYIVMINYEKGFDRQLPEEHLSLTEAVRRADLYANRNHDCTFVVTNEEGDALYDAYYTG